MSLETRIAELEAKLGVKQGGPHVVMMPGAFALDDESGMTQAKQQALAASPPPDRADRIVFIQFRKPKEISL